MKQYFFLLLIVFLNQSAYAQYAPQAGLPGSTAISATSGQFISWATHCVVQRGYMNIANPSLGYASAGDSSLAIGAADNSIVSLGDSGIAVLTFEHPIINGPGPDFAVFENGFLNTANDSEAYLELAFVEVSSDGINYFRFPVTSLTQNNVQIGNGDYINACNLSNLAGKYVGMYGTPFDLNDLAGIARLDINNVTHVRVVDVVGSIGEHGSRDNSGRVINDPYPTPFPSCGFDLDAVGVINQSGTGVKNQNEKVSVNVYPNPASDRVFISLKSAQADEVTATLTNITGQVLQYVSLSQGETEMHVAQYPAGLYFLVLRDATGNQWVEKVTRR